MHLSYHIFLATQLLLFQETFSCSDLHYEIHGECCPMCRPGYRVLKHCTASSSTNCRPCTEGMFMDESNGMEECFTCQNCDSGAHLTVKEECTSQKNTVCSCKPGYFCAHFIGNYCEQCIQHTVAPAGSMVTQAGTETNDTQFVECPPGTFSATEMSMSCEPWTNCSKAGMVEERAGTRTSDAECKCLCPDQGSKPLFISVVITLILLIFGFIGFIAWKQRESFRKGVNTGQREEQNREYYPVQENDKQMVPPLQETSPYPGEPTYSVA